MFAVQNGAFVASNNKGEGAWRSAPAAISGAADVSLVIESDGSMETSGSEGDYLRVFYVLDGGAEVPDGPAGGNLNGDAPETVRVSGLSGSTVQVVVRAKTTGGSETYTWDDVSVSSGAAAQGAPVVAGPEPEPPPPALEDADVRLYGTGAWVSYEQDDADQGRKRESRLMEKAGGRWRIAAMHTTVYGPE